MNTQTRIDQMIELNFEFFFIMMHLTVCCFHVRYVFQSQPTLYICLNFKELLTEHRGDIWSLRDCNGTGTLNEFVCKQTLIHLAKKTNWFSWILSTYMCGAFDCMFLTCHVNFSEWIYILHLSECQGTPYSKQAPHLKFKWLQRDSNSQPVRS